MRSCTWLLALLTLALATCSDDTKPSGGDRPTINDRSKLPPSETVPLPGDRATLKPDSRAWSCTPGAPNMCDGYKTQYCNNGVCTACPPDSTDCDRQGTCECKGICDGTKCRTP